VLKGCLVSRAERFVANLVDLPRRGKPRVAALASIAAQDLIAPPAQAAFGAAQAGIFAVQVRLSRWHALCCIATDEVMTRPLRGRVNMGDDNTDAAMMKLEPAAGVPVVGADGAGRGGNPERRGSVPRRRDGRGHPSGGLCSETVLPSGPPLSGSASWPAARLPAQCLPQRRDHSSVDERCRQRVRIGNEFLESAVRPAMAFLFLPACCTAAKRSSPMTGYLGQKGIFDARLRAGGMRFCSQEHRCV
jgi:hypothetical protein